MEREGGRKSHVDFFMMRASSRLSLPLLLSAIWKERERGKRREGERESACEREDTHREAKDGGVGVQKKSFAKNFANDCHAGCETLSHSPPPSPSPPHPRFQSHTCVSDESWGRV